MPDNGDPARRPRGGRARAVLAVVALVLGCVLAPLAVVAVWTSNEVADTDRYVANVAPLAGDPAMQDAIADRTSSEIVKRLDVSALLGELVGALEQRGLPANVGGKLQGLAGPITDGVSGFIHGKTLAVVRSDAFGDVWNTANREAHAGLVRALSGDDGRLLKQSGDTVSIDLGPLIALVKQKLVASGLSVASNIPDVHPTFALFQSDGLVKAQRGYRLLNTLKWALPILSIALLAVGVWLARRRRKALIGAALGLAPAMAVLGAGLWIGRMIVLDQVSAKNLNSAAAASLFDIVIRFLRDGLRMVLILGLVVAAAAYVTGPAPTAVRIRYFFSRTLGRAGPRTGRFGAWVGTYRTQLRIAAVVLAGLVFVFWDHPDGVVVLVIVALLLAVLAVIELLGRPPSGPGQVNRAQG